MNSAQTPKLPTFKVLIKADLKREGREEIIKKINSIRYSTFSMGNSVDVSATDLSKREREYLNKLLQEYKSGSYDSMNDIYEYKRDCSKVRTAKFVGLNNEFSQGTKNKVIEVLANNGVTDDRTAREIMNTDYDLAIWSELNKLEEI